MRTVSLSNILSPKGRKQALRSSAKLMASLNSRKPSNLFKLIQLNNTKRASIEAAGKQL